MWFKIIFSLVFTIITIIYTFFPNIKVDSTTIILVLMVFVPWFMKYLKSLELTGIGKVELITKEEKNKLDTQIEEFNSPNNLIIDKYRNIEDPKLSLAALRIDIEDKLNKIAQENCLNIHTYGITRLSSELYKKEVIDNNEYAIIKDIIGILNKAVHSRLEEYDIKSYNYIIDIGARLISSLDNKILK